MKSYLFLYLLSGGALFAAEEIAPNPYSGWLEGGAFGVVCTLTLVLALKVIPALYKANQEAETKRQEVTMKQIEVFRDTLETQQEQFTGALDKMSARFEQQLTTAMNALFQKVSNNGRVK